MDLEGSIVKINQVSEKQLKEMYFLMAEFYNNITEKNFLKDFLEKDYCIILMDRENRIKGFSTQKILTLNYKVNENGVNGVPQMNLNRIDRGRGGALEYIDFVVETVGSFDDDTFEMLKKTF